MYDDILGPVEEEKEIKIKPKLKNSLKAKKDTTLKANLGAQSSSSKNPSAPTVANVIDDDDEGTCPECGLEWEECECEVLEELDLDDDEDPDGNDSWNNVGGDCDEDCGKCDNG